MIKIEHEICCGCGVCVATCPKDAIIMKPDEEGFLYPVVDYQHCVNCGLCEKVCPSLHTYNPAIRLSSAFASKSIDKQVQLNSASGGVFPLLAKYVLNRDGFVFGASYNSEWQVEHIGINSKDDLSRLCRSKYVQSNAISSYDQVLHLLKQGTLVLFSGTPCQCSALRKYVKKDYPNLIIVDIVCHGVPSPLVWKKYLEETSVANGCVSSDVVDIQFKYKDGQTYFWKHPGFLIRWKNNEEYIDFANNTSYENSFLSGMNVRPSCYGCKVKSISSSSDITIGDFWGCDRVHPELFDNDGVSLVLVNSNRGLELWNNIQQALKCQSISIADAKKYNARLTVPVKRHKYRSLFFNSINSKTINESYEEARIKDESNMYNRIKAKCNGMAFALLSKVISALKKK